MKTSNLLLAVATLSSLVLTSGCTSVVIDQYRTGDVSREDTDAVVVLGRRYAANYDTEIDLISCVGKELHNDDNLRVIPEQQFIDKLYPWFEPRTAPMKVTALKNLVQREEVAEVMEEYNIRHIVWIDGKTETVSSAGSIGCSIGVGGAGCFGFGTWDNESNYEATIWDYEKYKLLGKISADATGTSYMPAVLIPIPLIARVQNSACNGLADQLRVFFAPDQNVSQQ
jgi:hypothetical protein